MSEPQQKTVIVEAPAAEAQAKFTIWLAHHRDLAAKLRPTDIELETVRDAAGKTLLRYKIPADLLV